MIRYRCIKCGTEWFTASLREGTRCGNCQGELEEETIIFDLKNDYSGTVNEEDNHYVE